MSKIARWIALGAAAYSFSIVLARNFVLEPSAVFAALTSVYRAIVGLPLLGLDALLAPALRWLSQAWQIGPLQVELGSDPLIQDGFIVLVVFMAILSRGLTSARLGVTALVVWGALVTLTTAVLRSSAGTLQPLPDLVPTEVSAAVWDFYKVQLIVIAPLVYLMGAALLSLVPAFGIAQRTLARTLGLTALAGVPLALFARAINATLLPLAGIDPFSSYLGVGAALVPALFILALALLYFALAVLTEPRDSDAPALWLQWRASAPAQIAGELAVLLFASSLLLAANIALYAAGL